MLTRLFTRISHRFLVVGKKFLFAKHTQNKVRADKNLRDGGFNAGFTAFRAPFYSFSVSYSRFVVVSCVRWCVLFPALFDSPHMLIAEEEKIIIEEIHGDQTVFEEK